MQKVIIYYTSDDYLDEFNNELSNGWNVKHLVYCAGDELVCVLEKETRKEKLEALNSISDGTR